MSEQYRFLPWSRQGLATKVTRPDTFDSAVPSRAGFPVRVRVNAGTPVGVDVRLYGPGDILGVDPRGIVRTDPRRYATDVEPNYMAAVEFDRPDFPWMFTPAGAGADERLRPWLVLAVVEKREGVAVQADRSRPLPAVTVPVAELPPLAESWAWAHTQVITAEATTAAIVANIRSQPDLNVSRILCPRRLEPSRDYLALLVPAFAAGVDAGLGRRTVAADLAPAWRGDEDHVQLPVYHHWEFSTGPGGDFESLARKLGPPTEPLDVGVVSLDLAGADPGLPPLPEGNVTLFEGALVGPFHESEDLLARLPDEWLEALAAILDAPQESLASGAEPEVPVAPPVYGAWPASTHAVSGDPPRWLRQLNLDPRLRAVAGLAAQVVRVNQEELMHDAWEQVGNLLEANRLLDRARFSREGALHLYRKVIEPLSEDLVFRLAAPLHARVALDTGTVKARLHDSAVPDATADPAFRRLASPGGRLMRRAGVAAEATPIVAGLDGGALAGDPAAVVPDAIQRAAGLSQLDLEQGGAVDTGPIGGKRAVNLELLTSTRTVVIQRRTVPKAIDIVVRPDIFGGGVIVSQTRDVAPPIGIAAPPGDRDIPDARIRPGDVLPDRDIPGRDIPGRDIPGRDIPGRDDVLGDRPLELAPIFDRSDVAIRQFVRAFDAHLATLADLPEPPAAPPLGLADVRSHLLARIDPAEVVRSRVASMIRVSTDEGGSSRLTPQGLEALERLTGTPRLDRPLYEPLAAYAPELLMPGIGRVAPNTVALVRTNPRFVESFLVGANTEFAGELLWREYPARRDGTPMRRFWDRPGGATDIPEIATFDPAAPIGASAGEGPEGDLVLLVRGDLLRRYPNAIIYAVRSNADGRLREGDSDRRDPVFRGRIDPDVTFLGFDLTVAETLEAPGWFFVIQQQPTEPRFGFDVPVEGEAPPKTWRDATWAHVGVAPGDHLSATAQITPPANGGGAAFLTNAAHLAAIALQQPVRVAIHARDLLGRDT